MRTVGVLVALLALACAKSCEDLDYTTCLEQEGCRYIANWSFFGCVGEYEAEGESEGPLGKGSCCDSLSQEACTSEEYSKYCYEHRGKCYHRSRVDCPTMPSSNECNYWGAYCVNYDDPYHCDYLSPENDTEVS